MKLKLFPNPVQSKIELRFKNTSSREITIYQHNGSRLYHKNYPSTKNIEIDVNFLTEGLYILKSTTQHGQQAVKFVIDNQ